MFFCFCLFLENLAYPKIDLSIPHQNIQIYTYFTKSYEDFAFKLLAIISTISTILYYFASSPFLVNGYAYILPYRLHTYLGLNIDGSPY